TPQALGLRWRFNAVSYAVQHRFANEAAVFQHDAVRGGVDFAGETVKRSAGCVITGNARDRVEYGVAGSEILSGGRDVSLVRRRRDRLKRDGVAFDVEIDVVGV